MQSPLETKIDDMIRPVLDSQGFDLVCVKITGADQPTVQIMADKPGDDRITIDDCTEISRTVSALMDVEDPINGRYRLEVSSPGLDRPLVKLSDFERFQGHSIKLEAPGVLENRKRYRGTIEKIDNDIITLSTETGEEFDIPYNAIQSAKLVMTDELLAEQQQRRTGNDG